MTERQVHSDELRRKSRELLNEVEHGGAHVTILRYDTPAAVMVPVSWYRRMLAVKRGVLAFTRDSDTAHWLPGETELPVGELLAAISDAGLSVLDEEPDLP
jgi:prevent-host-death family protein